MKKGLISTLSLILIANLFSITIYADEAKVPNDSETRAPVCEYMISYTESTSSNKPYNIVTTMAINETATTQTMTVNKTRSRTFSGNISATAERQAVLAKVGGRVEVGYGVTNTVSVSASTVVPGNTTYKVDIGSILLTTSGTISITNKDCSLTKKNNLNLKWTEGEYIRWYK